MSAAPSSVDGWDRAADQHVHRFVLAHPWLGDAARAVTHLGDPLVVTIGTLALAAVLLVRGRRHAALYVVAVRLVAVLTDTGLKQAVGRPRPVLVHPIASAGGYSFPSGHALGSAALWASLALVLLSGRPWTRLVVALAVPTVVAVTRVLLGVHYVTDVTGGLLLGVAIAVLLARLFPDTSGVVHPPFTPRT